MNAATLSAKKNSKPGIKSEWQRRTSKESLSMRQEYQLRQVETSLRMQLIDKKDTNDADSRNIDPGKTTDNNTVS
ncbi:hypothetical protein TSAR_002543 [Trichomalopsis sarcophagae]|uniref:Uncharacterized protein n=1 Tax=Trichomalopsis sarcophagae TaxID=543379 RepID=A0A232EI47_9HYME|nr:hypothetical protein TSAR_002543 [Trichomalopsis sarcophagae]